MAKTDPLFERLEETLGKFLTGTLGISEKESSQLLKEYMKKGMDADEASKFQFHLENKFRKAGEKGSTHTDTDRQSELLSINNLGQRVWDRGKEYEGDIWRIDFDVNLWKQHKPNVDFKGRKDAEELYEELSQREINKRLDQEAKDWENLGKKPKTVESTEEEMLDWGARQEYDVDSYGEAVAEAEKIKRENPIQTMLLDAQKQAPVTNRIYKLQSAMQQGRKQAEERAKIDSMTPEERGKYLQKQREQREQREAEQRKAKRMTSEEEPEGLSYIGAEGGKSLDGKDLNGYDSVHFDKDDVISMLTEKYSESMGSTGAIKRMTDNIQRDLNKGYQKIMSSKSKNKKEEIDNLIGELASRIDDGPGVGDYIMGNKLHTGAIGLAAMASTMGIAFGGHKSNAELYSSPF